MKLLILFWMLLLILELSGCDSEETPPVASKQLHLIASHALSVCEPSGLTMDINGNYLWTVSDSLNEIYKITLRGATVKTLECQAINLEGITQNPADATLYVIDENSSEVIHLDTLGNEIERFQLESSPDTPFNHLEGIAFCPYNNHLYLLNEKYPRLLIEVDSSYIVLNQYELNFSEDCSGVTFDESNNRLWIVSDESQTVTVCDLDGRPVESYSIDVIKAEGIAIDPAGKLIYIVSDAEDKLYIFSMP